MAAWTAYLNRNGADDRGFRMFRPIAAALALALLSAAPAVAAPSTDPTQMPAGTYVLDKSHASVLARVRHQGFSNFTIRFDGVDATYAWDPKSPQTAEVRATIQAASFDSGAPKEDPKLARQFLDVEKHPTITFVSTSIQHGEGDKGTILGDLTLRGVTRPVTLDVIYNGYAGGVTGQRAGFSATTRIKRSDFGSTYLLSPPLALVGDEVELILELEFTRKAP